MEAVSIVVAGGVLADPQYLLEKYENDGSISVWAGFTSDGDKSRQVDAAVCALPLPNGKIRVAKPAELRLRGWELRHTPENASVATDSNRHYDAVYNGFPVELAQIEQFIVAFDEPIPNPWRQR